MRPCLKKKENKNNKTLMKEIDYKNKVKTSVLVTLQSLLEQIPDTQNEGRKGLFSSQLLEVSVHIRLAQG